MRKIKYFVACIVILALMPSCHEHKTDDETAQIDSINSELNDSLATALAEKDSLMTLMNEIAEGMNQIKDMQDIVSAPNLNSETPDRKNQLRNDIVLIQQSIEQRKKRLAELEKRLKQSNNYNEEMRKTIENLKKQLENQQSTIDDLTKQLAAAHVQITALNNRVDSLNTVNTEVRQEKQKAQEETQRVTNEMNVCYYAIGSKKELKAHKIIESRFLRKTKIMEGDFEKSYFTKADKRTLNSIPLHAKKVEIMSKHPAGSYEIIESGDGKVLKITNPSRFWELSNFLVVKVN
ncbi:MAG: hypothetical protein IKQ89_01180 [Muribaculaceae bacterium]|nr:hypothetical protein [Muribaculaceae bacterium]